MEQERLHILREYSEGIVPQTIRPGSLKERITLYRMGSFYLWLRSRRHSTETLVIIRVGTNPA